jgi:hypothetical protein
MAPIMLHDMPRQPRFNRNILVVLWLSQFGCTLIIEYTAALSFLVLAWMPSGHPTQPMYSHIPTLLFLRDQLLITIVDQICPRQCLSQPSRYGFDTLRSASLQQRRANVLEVPPITNREECLVHDTDGGAGVLRCRRWNRCGVRRNS